MKHVKPGHTHPIICLDAGHSGDSNQSPAVPEYYESNMSWTLHLLLKSALERYGIEVRTTRTTQDTVMDVYQRGAASKGCDLFLSLHSNAVGSETNETVDRVMVYVPLDGSGDEIGQMFVDQISLIMETIQTGQIATREGSNGEYYGVLRGAAAVGTTGLILEHSFHTNTRSTHWLLEENHLERLAEEEALLIAEYFDVADRNESVESSVLYRVQIGAFRVKANADALLSEVKAAGYDAYIITQPVEEALPVSTGYSLKQFILDVQNVIGANTDGLAGTETLNKTPTVSRYINATHPVVIPIQKRLKTLGYTQVGTADGIAGSGFELAVKAFQRDNDITADGELTTKGPTWRKLLGMN